MPFFSQASSITGKVEGVFVFIFSLSVVFLLLITALMVVFVVRYSRKRHPKGVDIEGATWLEVTWTAVPLVLFLAMFYFGWTNFQYMRNPPKDAMVVEATGRQWAWSFKYPNGRQESELTVALNRPVKVELKSLDVLHGFYIPAFRVKADVVPGKKNFLWFTPTLLGTFDIECTVMCGVDHSYMLSKVRVVPEEGFRAWYFRDEEAPASGQAAPRIPADVPVAGAAGRDEAPGAPRAPGRTEPAPRGAAAGEAGLDQGLAVLTANECLACHTTDGAPSVGPTFKGTFGSKEIVLAGGEEREIVIDEAYLRRAIQEPGAEIVKGFPPAMPDASLTEQELEAVIQFIKRQR